MAVPGVATENLGHFRAASISGEPEAVKWVHSFIKEREFTDRCWDIVWLRVSGIRMRGGPDHDLR
jgi:hypothetical protein